MDLVSGRGPTTSAAVSQPSVRATRAATKVTAIAAAKPSRSLPGSGIVYVLTVAETERVAGFLLEQGLKVAAYSGQTTNRVRWWIGYATTRSKRWSPPRRWGW